MDMQSIGNMPDYQYERTEFEQLGDTHPINVEKSFDTLDRWRRVVGFLCLIAAVGLTGATALVLVIPVRPDVKLEAPSLASPTAVVAAIPTTTQNVGFPESIPPTLSAEVIQTLLSTPMIQSSNPKSIETVRSIYDPFTIIPDRPRSEVIEYDVVSGDTIYSIAERFALQPETIAWSNDRSITLALRPANKLNILPVDGVYHIVFGEETIEQIASRYGVDPYTIIDSQYNDLEIASPETVVPTGTRLVIAGGRGEQISWTPAVVRVDAGSGTAGNTASSSGKIGFAIGDPGSCGLVDNPGGGAGWARPYGGYTWIRGFSSIHTAVDLAGSEGTPVYAANSGRVIFAGWSSYGYGYTVVLAHGPFTTLYAHLSDINVGCGDSVSAGQQIAGSGNSGNSSGPHLHFEIRYQDVPQDPSYTIAF